MQRQILHLPHKAMQMSDRVLGLELRYIKKLIKCPFLCWIF